MATTIALIGNPNSGKTTMFNVLTGSTQRVGNWPGVTVDKKEGVLKKQRDVSVMDLPGIYSLSPYTQEEVISRDYMIRERPDSVINLVDATNIERNLYLTMQLLDTGVPVVIALNMIDVANKSGDKIDVALLSKLLDCPIVETCSLNGSGLDELSEKAVAAASAHKASSYRRTFSPGVEAALNTISGLIKDRAPAASLRWHAIKCFERDEKVLDELKLSADTAKRIEEATRACEKAMDDSCASIITGETYDLIEGIVKKCHKRANNGLSISDKIDLIVTNRWLGLPIFGLVMFLVYYVSVTTVGALVTDFTNDMVVGEWIQAPIAAWLSSIGTADWLVGLITDGIIGGVGAVLGFLPQMLILFLFLALLEDCGYMARIAFLMDRLFRKFGMSGKSFIPLLIGTGCGVPGIMAARTIEQQRDRRITVITTTFMPCGAKLPIIALIAGALFGGAWWVGPSAYFLGIGSVVISGIMLKKTKPFMGETAPFVMELPAYHLPTFGNVSRSMWERCVSFAKKAATVYTLAAILVWFSSSFGMVNGSFGLVENLSDSLLYAIGNSFMWVFNPLGFGRWEAAVASILGLSAKEQIVGVFGVLTSIGNADVAYELVDAADASGLSPIAALFSGGLAAYSFLVFNLLCAPCFAAINTIRQEMKDWRWTTFAVAYQCGFAYLMALMIYQFGMLFTGGGFTVGTGAAVITLLAMLYMLFRPAPKTQLTPTNHLAQAA